LHPNQPLVDRDIPTEALFFDSFTVNVSGMITGKVLEDSLPEEQDHPIDLAKSRVSDFVGDLNPVLAGMDFGSSGFRFGGIDHSPGETRLLRILDTEGDRANDQVRVAVNIGVRMRWSSERELSGELKSDFANKMAAHVGRMALTELENAELPFAWSVEDTFTSFISDGA